MRRIAIIGASGLIGRALIALLRDKPDISLIATARRPPLGDAGIAGRAVEVTDAAAVTRAIAGATHVVNCVMGTPRAMEEGLKNLCAAAAQGSNPTIIHFSTCAVFGTATGRLDEAAPTGTGVDWYGRSKLNCEATLAAHVAAGGRGVILRPSCVYGPGSALWTWRIGRLLKARRLGDLGAAGDGFCNLLYVDDAAAAVWAAIEREKTGGEIYHLNAPDPPRWNDYLKDFGRALGAIPLHRPPPWQLALERRLLAPALRASRLIADRLHVSVNSIPDAITPSLLRNFHTSVIYESNRATRELGMLNTPYGTGISRAADWLNHAL